MFIDIHNNYNFKKKLINYLFRRKIFFQEALFKILKNINNL